MKTTVSVIIPAYNSAQYVADAVRAALSQTHRPSQIIVVNDGSTDSTEQVLSQFSRDLTVIRQSNAGLPSARNAGLRVAAGDWIAFLDADDSWHPRKLELQLAVAATSPDLGLIGTTTYDFPNETPPTIGESIALQPVPLDRLLVRNYFTASSVLVRRDVAERVGTFDPPLPNAEDWDYWIRSAETAPVANVLAPLTGYRQVAGSLSRRPIAMEHGIRTVIAKLDARNAWKGRHWLRRRAISHLHNSIAHLYGASGDQAAAIKRMIQSFVSYPFPFDRYESPAALARPRRTAVLMLRHLGWISTDHGIATARRTA